jgi:uncharacterized damage-inducible protein DinB
MNETLIDPIRHNNWATRRRVGFCREKNLSDEQPTTPAPGTFGSILATLNHIVTADGFYLRRLLGSGPGWLERPEDVDGAAQGAACRLTA